MGRGGDGGSGSARGGGAALVLAALLWAVAPTTAAVGQAADGGRSGVELDAAALVVAPLTDLAPGTETVGGLQISSSVGMQAAGLLWLGPRLAVGAAGTWIPVDVERLAGTGPEGEPIPGERVAGADYLAGSLEAILTLPSIGTDVRVEPYLVGGAGLRRLGVDGNPEEAPSATDPMVTLGGGFRTLLSAGWLLRLEARDHLSLYDGAEDGRAQHDLTVSVGIGLRP